MTIISGMSDKLFDIIENKEIKHKTNFYIILGHNIDDWSVPGHDWYGAIT